MNPRPPPLGEGRGGVAGTTVRRTYSPCNLQRSNPPAPTARRPQPVAHTKERPLPSREVFPHRPLQRLGPHPVLLVNPNQPGTDASRSSSAPISRSPRSSPPSQSMSACVEVYTTSGPRAADPSASPRASPPASPRSQFPESIPRRLLVERNDLAARSSRPGQSSTARPSSAHAGLVAHNIPCTPEPRPAAPPAPPAPTQFAGKCREEVGRLPVRDARHARSHPDRERLES